MTENLPEAPVRTRATPELISQLATCRVLKATASATLRHNDFASQWNARPAEG